MINYKKPKISFNFYRTYFSWKPHFTYNRTLIWKDKFNSPRCELEPFIRFEFLIFGFLIIQGDYTSWEQWLWVHKYNGGDVDQAKETWPWRNVKTKLSTWKD
jgi:hypothetical protein